MTKSTKSKINSGTIMVIVVIGFAFISIPLLIFIGDQQTTAEFERHAKESIQKNVVWVESFKTLTDCTEMLKQLTEHNRFWNSTFQDQAWGHYKELCA